MVVSHKKSPTREGWGHIFDRCGGEYLKKKRKGKRKNFLNEQCKFNMKNKTIIFIFKESFFRETLTRLKSKTQLSTLCAVFTVRSWFNCAQFNDHLLSLCPLLIMLTIESTCKVTFWCLWAEGVMSLRKTDSGLVRLKSLVKKDPGLDSTPSSSRFLWPPALWETRTLWRWPLWETRTRLGKSVAVAGYGHNKRFLLVSVIPTSAAPYVENFKRVDQYQCFSRHPGKEKQTFC